MTVRQLQAGFYKFNFRAKYKIWACNIASRKVTAQASCPDFVQVICPGQVDKKYCLLISIYVIVLLPVYYLMQQTPLWVMRIYYGQIFCSKKKNWLLMIKEIIFPYP